MYMEEKEHCLVVVVCSCRDFGLDEGGTSKPLASVREPAIVLFESKSWLSQNGSKMLQTFAVTSCRCRARSGPVARLKSSFPKYEALMGLVNAPSQEFSSDLFRYLDILSSEWSAAKCIGPERA